jgi:ribonuclease HII
MRRWSRLEAELRSEGYRAICGVDEAGRGPLAGPVVAAAVVLPPRFKSRGIADSKALTGAKRLVAYKRITTEGLSCAFATASVEEIEELNILQATFLAMRRAVAALGPAPDYLLVDGNLPIPQIEIPCRPVVGGDSCVLAIACASIIAKVHRDRLMQQYHQLFPEYGFDRHKGYPTSHHRRMIRKHGPAAIHRRSFRLLGEQEDSELDL